MIYYMDHLDTVDEALLQELYPYLSKERLAYKSRYRFQSDQTQSVLAYILLRIGLFEEYGISHVPKLGVTSTGKPYLQDRSDVHFNLSHCKKGVACGIDCAPLGVDIQNYVEYKASMVKHFMSPAEIEMAHRSGIEFTRIWTLKESYGKYLGTGICYDMPNYTVREGVADDACISKSNLLRDFVISATAQKELPLVQIYAYELPQRCRLLEKEMP